MRKAQGLTPREAAARLGVRLDGLYSLLWCKKLPAEKRDGRWLIPVSAIEARLEKRGAEYAEASR